MIKKLSTAAILTTTILGGNLPFAYGMDKLIREEGNESTSSNRVVKIPMKVNPDGSYEFLNSSVPTSTPIETENPQEAPPVTNVQKMHTELLELQQKAAAIQAALLKEAQEQAQAQAEETLKQQQQIAIAIAAQKEELARQEEALKQQQEANAKQSALLEQQKREAEEAQQRAELEKQKAEAAAQVAETQKRLIEEERQKIAAAHQAAEDKRRIEEESQQAAAAQERARLEREAEDLVNQAVMKLNAWIGAVDSKISRHNRRVDERTNNAQWKSTWQQFATDGQKRRGIKNHELGIMANDDPNQTLIKLSATDDNLFSTLKSKWDRFPELEGKMRAAKLAKIKQDLGIQ